MIVPGQTAKLPGDVIDQKSSSSTPVVGAGYGSEGLLAGLQFSKCFDDDKLSGGEIQAECRRKGKCNLSLMRRLNHDVCK